MPTPVGRGDLVLDRDERRPGVVRRPPRAGHQLGPRRRLGGVAEAAVAPQRPVLDPGLIHRHALDADDAAPDHRPELQDVRTVDRGHRLLEAVGLVPLDVHEEHAGRALGQMQLDLGREIALEQGDHGQHRQPGAERHDHAPRPRARTLQVGERDAHTRAAPFPDQPGRPQDEPGDAGQQGGRDHRHRDEDRAEAAVGDPGHRERCERRQAEPEPDQRGDRRQAPRRHQQRPEHAGGRHLTGPREWPDGEHQRAQQPAGRRDQQRNG